MQSFIDNRVGGCFFFSILHFMEVKFAMVCTMGDCKGYELYIHLAPSRLELSILLGHYSLYFVLLVFVNVEFL